MPTSIRWLMQSDRVGLALIVPLTGAMTAEVLARLALNGASDRVHPARPIFSPLISVGDIIITL